MKALRPAFLALLLLLAALALAGCGGGGDEAAAPPPAEAAPGFDESGDQVGGDPVAGEAVWAEAGCGSCHTLAAAGSTATVGPNLDTLQPDYGSSVDQITLGGGGMPAYADQLSEQQIIDLASYVVVSTTG